LIRLLVRSIIFPGPRLFLIYFCSILALIVPLLFMEYKHGLKNPKAGMNQAKFYLISGVSFLASLGIFEIPLFAVATVGSVGRLLSAWGRPGERLSDDAPYESLANDWREGLVSLSIVTR